jgi:hypothetical protein
MTKQRKKTLPSLGEEFDPEIQQLVRLVVIAQHAELWPEPTVAQVNDLLFEEYGRIPSLSALADRFGEDLVKSEAQRFLKRRKSEIAEAEERLGVDSPCHLCGDDDVTTFYEFGLAKILERKQNWGGAIASLALNVVTVPFGMAIVPRPGTTTTAQIARCRLMMCDDCVHHRRGLLGGLKVTEQDCAFHPSWDRLVNAGHAEFLNTEQLARYK